LRFREASELDFCRLFS